MEINRSNEMQLIIFTKYREIQTRAHKFKIINSSSVTNCILVDCSLEANPLD